MALVPNREPHRYGGVQLADDGHVIGFVARGAAAAGSYHFIGAQIVQAAAFRDLADGEPINSVGNVYEKLMAAQPGCIRGYLCEAAFWDIGTPEDLARTNAAFASVRSVRL